MSISPNLASIAQPKTMVVAMRLAGSPPPKIEIDQRFLRAFPDQAEALERFSDELKRWWIQVSIESQRDNS